MNSGLMRLALPAGVLAFALGACVPGPDMIPADGVKDYSLAVETGPRGRPCPVLAQGQSQEIHMQPGETLKLQRPGLLSADKWVLIFKSEDPEGGVVKSPMADDSFLVRLNDTSSRLRLKSNLSEGERFPFMIVNTSSERCPPLDPVIIIGHAF